MTKRSPQRPSGLKSATLLEWEASLFGACFIAFGLGALLADVAQAYAPAVIAVGILVHGWGMYRVHRRNR
jgi:hypothetical protein